MTDYRLYKSKLNQQNVEEGQMFDNKHSDDQVELIGYGSTMDVKILFSDGRVGFGTVRALKNGTIKPE